jgi:hypothetical protein
MMFLNAGLNCHSPQELTDWLSLDVDLIVKASSGTLLGGR